MRKLFINKITQAVLSLDIDEIQSVYLDLLSDLETLQKYLSVKEIGDIYFNASLNHFDMAHRSYEQGDYPAVLKTIRHAKSDLKNATIRYTASDDKRACDDMMKKYDQMQTNCRAELLLSDQILAPDENAHKKIRLSAEHDQIIEKKFKKPKCSDNRFFPEPKRLMPSFFPENFNPRRLNG